MKIYSMQISCKYSRMKILQLFYKLLFLKQYFYQSINAKGCFI